MRMTENEALDKLNNLHYKIVHTSFCNKVYESEIEALCMAKDCLKEIQQYKAIGTIEEFKALKEKATPKKLEVEKFGGYDDLMCPNCKSYKIRNPKYCCDCGQKLDWQ